jgi:hypothetical protein
MINHLFFQHKIKENENILNSYLQNSQKLNNTNNNNNNNKASFSTISNETGDLDSPGSMSSYMSKSNDNNITSPLRHSVIGAPTTSTSNSLVNLPFKSTDQTSKAPRPGSINSPTSLMHLFTKESLAERLNQIDENKLEKYLQIGSLFKFRIIILEISGISSDFTDIFCQFNFMHRTNEAFSTEPIQNSGKGPPLGFFHIQNFSVTVTRSFIDYITHQPLLFEVLGHYQHHPLHGQALSANSLNNNKNKSKTPMKYLNKPAMSKPIPAKTIKTLKNVSTSHVVSEFDVMVWYEICEMGENGEYIPVTIDHSDESPCNGKFLLHQGVQRRIAITLCHESGADIVWKDVKEVVIGKLFCC